MEQYPHYNSDEHMAENNNQNTKQWKYPPEISFQTRTKDISEEVVDKKQPTFVVLVVISIILIIMLISAMVAYFMVLRRKRKAYNVEESRQKHQKDVVLVSENNV